MHRSHPFYRTFELGLVIHVTAESYVYSYIALCTLLHVANYIRLYNKHGYIENVSLLKSRKRIWKQASTSYAFTCEPSCIRFVQNKGCGQCAFPSRIMIPIQKQVICLQGFGITWQRVPSQK